MNPSNELIPTTNTNAILDQLMNKELEPLPYNVAPPTPRPSFTRILQLSSYLFPSNLRLSISSSSTRGDDDNQAIEQACKTKNLSGHASPNTPDSQMTTAANNRVKSRKKVTFQCKVVSIPPDHSPTEHEKRCVYYNKQDYDGFKLDAAQNAGVRLFDYCPQKQNQSATKGANTPVSYPHKFVMIGSFDEDIKKSSLPTDATINGDRKRATRPISHHVPIQCHNEYADSTNTQGDEICKRGLGYHFSRYRKRNRVWTRAMVLTWQKVMREMKVKDGMTQEQARHFQQQPLMLSQKCEIKLNDTSQALLAVVSSKCSRSSRQAALWRGKMDYEMAHPENRKVSLGLGLDNQTHSYWVDSNKRATDHCEEQSHRKRQRYDTSNDTSNACTYLAGVLSVPI